MVTIINNGQTCRNVTVHAKYMCVYEPHPMHVKSTVAAVVAVIVSPKKYHNLTVLVRNKRRRKLSQSPE